MPAGSRSKEKRMPRITEAERIALLVGIACPVSGKPEPAVGWVKP